MGGEQSTAKAQPLTQVTLEIECSKTFYNVQIERDRRVNELQRKEGQLKEILSQPHVATQSAIHEAANCITVLNHVLGCNIIMRNLNVLKENSIFICKAVNCRENLGNIEPLIHTIVWSTSRLNINSLKEFSGFISHFVNKNIYQIVETSPIVDIDMKKKFANVIPDPLEIQDYLSKFIKRNNLDDSIMTKIYPGGGFGGGQDVQGEQDFMAQLNNLRLDGGSNPGGTNQRPPGPGGFNQAPPSGGFGGMGGFIQPPNSSQGSSNNPFMGNNGGASSAGFDERIREMKRIGA